MTNLKRMNRADLIKKIEGLTVVDTDETTNSKVSNLISEIDRLKRELTAARQTDKFVAIENLSLGRVWLYAPESKSGRPEDSNSGRLIKQPGELQIVPSYWMAVYIADRAPAFKMGEVCMNNDRGRLIAPHLVFEDMDLPTEFLDAAVSNEEIEKSISGSAEDFYDFIESHRNEMHILNRVYGVVDRAAYNAPAKSKKKSILDGYVSYLDEIIHPTVDPEKPAEEATLVI